MIDDQEVRNRAAALGVPESQIRGDHLLSHLIGALALEDGVVFIGGTALNRTHLPDRASASGCVPEYATRLCEAFGG